MNRRNFIQSALVATTLPLIPNASAIPENADDNSITFIPSGFLDFSKIEAIRHYEAPLVATSEKAASIEQWSKVLLNGEWSIVAKPPLWIRNMTYAAYNIEFIDHNMSSNDEKVYVHPKLLFAPEYVLNIRP